ncbi:hypothetical protein YPPY54_2233, partial [Yersinia pestis PY-54]
MTNPAFFRIATSRVTVLRSRFNRVDSDVIEP